jgi:thioesterase domain-containing protein
MYPLMEPHKYALKMQEEMIREIEAADAEFLVFAKVQYSWAMQPESQKRILDWYEEYTKANYDLVRIYKDPVEPTKEQLQIEPGLTSGLLLLYQRKPGRP